MELKKNPKFDLDKDRGLYFSFGLCLMLFLTWFFLEMKTYDKETLFDYSLTEDREYREDIPIINLTTPPPPPPPVTPPETIEIVANEVEIEETVLSSTETDQYEAIPERIISVEEVQVGEVIEDIYVPFAVIEEVPIFPGCEGTPKELMRKCFVEKMQDHVKKNFHYPQRAMENNIQGKVYVQFTIDENGHIVDIMSRAPDFILQESAENLMKSLPEMTPGRQRGKPVKVKYSLPIVFKLMNQ